MSGMKEKDESKHKIRTEASPKALARYAAVTWTIERMKDSHPDGITLSKILENGASRDWNGFHFGTSTLERYYYSYKEGGFEALCDKKRSDEGKLRKLPEELADVLLVQRRKHLKMDITVLLDMMRDNGIDILAHSSLSSVYRLLRKHGLDRTTIRNINPDPLYGPAKSFEMPSVNMLWMTDMMWGPTFRNTEGKVVKARLFALLDDHSRLCTGAEYFNSESLDCFLKVLQQAILRRGIPDKIYTDRGKIYMSHHLQVICANMGIKLSHARPYHAWSKGKVERFFRRVQQQFQARLVENPVHSLADLNERLSLWLEEKYHVVVHKGTGQSPAERFAADVDEIRNPPSAEEVKMLFMKRIDRRVSRDGCVSVNATQFEAPLSLRGMTVQVRHTIPLDDHVEIWHQDKLAGIGHPVNKHFNATNFKRRK